jgi:7-cyano-7-deazaguanine synthase
MAAKAVVLLSGGLDSAVALYWARARGFTCRCVSFDYGQRHARELAAAKLLARKAGCAWETVAVRFPWKGSSLLDRRMSLPHTRSRAIPSTYVPGRNIVFLSLALSCAEAWGAQAIVIGAHSQDYSGYPDCRPQFMRAFERMARAGTKAGVQGKPVRVLAPLLHKNKAQIIRLGVKLGVPLGSTRSCYANGIRPCGVCDSCHYRNKGFREAGVTDPSYHNE